ncbi:MAG: thioredoxin family protein [Bacilli bacterium]|nr:thioredoxin family protein [Bacilli bacterium]
MNETKKLYTLLAVVAAVVILVGASVVSGLLKGEKYVKMVDTAFASKENKLVLLGRPTCSYCNLLKPVLDSFAKKYNFSYEYVNTDETGNAKLDTILGKFDIDSNSFGTPYMAVVKDGKKVAEQQGYVEENKLFTFLQDNGFIKKEEKLALNYIDYSKYKELLEGGSKRTFVMVQTGCSYCESAKPILEEIAAEYKLDINILNITNIATEAEKEEFNKSLPYLSENEWGTPLMLTVEDKKVVADKSGAATKEEYISYFKKNGYIKE